VKIGKIVIISSDEAKFKDDMLREQAKLIKAQESYISSLEELKNTLFEKILELEVTNKTMTKLQEYKEETERLISNEEN